MSDASYPPPPPPGPPYGSPYGAPPALPPQGNAQAVAAFVLGVIALVLAAVPLVGAVGVVLALIGVGLGIAGLGRGRRVGRGTRLAGWGIGLSVLALAVCAVVSYYTLRYLGDWFDTVDPPEPSAEVGEWFTTDDGDLAVKVTALTCGPAQDDPTGPDVGCDLTFEARNDSDETISLGDITVKSVLDGAWGSVTLQDPVDPDGYSHSYYLEPGDSVTLNGNIRLGNGERLDGIAFDANDASSHSAVVVDAGEASSGQ